MEQIVVSKDAVTGLIHFFPNWESAVDYVNDNSPFDEISLYGISVTSCATISEILAEVNHVLREEWKNV